MWPLPWGTGDPDSLKVLWDGWMFSGFGEFSPFLQCLKCPSCDDCWQPVRDENDEKIIGGKTAESMHHRIILNKGWVNVTSEIQRRCRPFSSAVNCWKHISILPSPPLLTGMNDCISVTHMLLVSICVSAVNPLRKRVLTRSGSPSLWKYWRLRAYMSMRHKSCLSMKPGSATWIGGACICSFVYSNSELWFLI